VLQWIKQKRIRGVLKESQKVEENCVDLDRDGSKRQRIIYDTNSVEIEAEGKELRRLGIGLKEGQGS
jgi:hypothetical protein